MFLSTISKILLLLASTTLATKLNIRQNPRFNLKMIDKLPASSSAGKEVEMRAKSDMTNTLSSMVIFYPEISHAISSSEQSLNQLFDPSKFQPVCPASDGVYQVLKITANSLVGEDNTLQYGPLIASLLLRIRLEICVLESFINEAVVPFIRQNGISWILPLHETLETFLAGTIFALGCNVVLLGSTKIISVLFLFGDFSTGFPARVIGDLLKRFSQPKSPGDIAGTGIKLYGDLLGTIRGVVENIDLFVGRYLVLVTTCYILFKLLHFKLFNYLF